MGNVVCGRSGAGSRSRFVGGAMCGLSVKRAVRAYIEVHEENLTSAGKECALLNKRRTVLPSTDPALALVVIPPPDFLWLDGGGWGSSWFDKVGIAAGQSGVAEDGRER